MAARILGALALLALGVGPAWAETLGQLLKARVAPPLHGLQACGVLDEQDLPVERFPGGLLARVHINPSAECTVVLGPDLAVRGVLAGWPVATLADGRIVYQRNQVHLASFHPVALALFDPRRGTDLTLYPRNPYRAARAAHVARMRSVYSPAWCNAHNHPCDPDTFDEHVNGEIVTDARGDALAFVTACDNTTDSSDAERWGRLEAFRELRAALGRWDGRGEPPAELQRNLAAGLARVRNMQAEAHVAAALANEPTLAALVGPALTGRPAPGQGAQSWLVALDGRWADPETRFGPEAPRRALEGDVLRQIFRTDPD